MPRGTMTTDPIPVELQKGLWDTVTHALKQHADSLEDEIEADHVDAIRHEIWEQVQINDHVPARGESE